MNPRLLIAIAAISAGVIAYQIILMRLFAVSLWQHFGYLVISIALLGFGLSGTVIALSRNYLLCRFAMTWHVNAVLFAVGAVAANAITQRLGFNPLELPWDATQLARLALIYIVLMVPFFAAANCIGLAFARAGEHAGRIYRYNLVGSGIGALLALASLFAMRPENGLRLVFFLGLAASAMAISGRRRLWALELAIAGGLVAIAMPGVWVAPQPSNFKDLSMALQVPAASVVAEAFGPLGLVSALASPTVPIRHAPGLSLNATSGPPPQLALFSDGELVGAVNRFDGDRASSAYLDFTTAALPYHLLERPRVLSLEPAGGAAILLARYHRASAIDAVEHDPSVARLLAGPLRDFSGGVYVLPEVSVHVAEPRNHIAGAQTSYDLIQLPTVHMPVGGIRETFTYTIEAFGEYLDKLTPGGYLTVTSDLELPPRHALKLLATVIEALERRDVSVPEARIGLIRGWRTATLIVKNGELDGVARARLRAFAQRRSFDVAYYPGMARAEANRFNAWAEPFLYDGALALLGAERDAYFARHKFHLRPATDDRPFFFDLLRWRSLPELWTAKTHGAVSLIEWGYVLLAATVIQAIMWSTLLILAPLARLRSGASAGLRARVCLYFVALGLAFLFIEMTFFQRLILFLGHPVYSISLVLGAFLAFAGLGAGWANRVERDLARRGLQPITCTGFTVAAVVLGYALVLPPLLGELMMQPLLLRAAFALAVIAPLALLMGLPFPLALQRLSVVSPGLVPWAWGINGCASVVSAVLAILLAVEVGFGAVTVVAAALYGAAALAMHRALPASKPAVG